MGGPGAVLPQGTINSVNCSPIKAIILRHYPTRTELGCWSEGLGRWSEGLGRWNRGGEDGQAGHFEDHGDVWSFGDCAGESSFTGCTLLNLYG